MKAGLEAPDFAVKLEATEGGRQLGATNLGDAEDDDRRLLVTTGGDDVGLGERDALRRVGHLP